MEFKAEDDAVFLTLDGQIGIELVRGDQIRMRKAAEKLLLVRPAKKTYYQILQQQIKVGREISNRRVLFLLWTILINSTSDAYKAFSSNWPS